jgi:hypothetical protein
MTSILKPYDFNEKFPLCYNSNCLLRLEPTNRFYCNYCKNVFCAEHLKTYYHDCKNKPEEKNLPIAKNENTNKTGLPKCNKSKCTTLLNLSNKSECSKCKKLYCLSHRFDFSHECIIK